MWFIINPRTKQIYIMMMRISFLALLSFLSITFYGQQSKITEFLSDSSMMHSSVSLCIIDADSGKIVSQYNPGKSLTQASILKLVTTAVSLELLGKDYKFKTGIGYSGKIKKGRKTLLGDIIIKGGGDPALWSENFTETYNGFIDKWILDIKAQGIKRIKGRVIADDSYYDYEPVPTGWGWDDLGNYYGAGAYGLSISDNTLKIHFKTGGKGTKAEITNIFPEDPGIELTNYLISSGTGDNGYIYSAPYSSTGWITGTITENSNDFILNGSIPDPPLYFAKTLNKKLNDAGIKISGNPSTARLLPDFKKDSIKIISEISSPPLSEIIDVLNHKSVNLYAEHLIKELGKVFKGNGTTAAGIEVVNSFLDSIGVNTKGMFIEDGSGLSSLDAVNSEGMVKLLYFMKKNSRFFDEYFKSLPEAGKNGTLKSYFKDPVFENRLRAKSGSLTRVRSYAGYFTTLSGKEMIFCIIVNNYNGSSRRLITGIEEIIKEVIVNR
jgi:D-alanyl-D-alanine carboxypeptidase/D-alanyl-D-alanine-endopeptidase (penicillin-binding protein 4)